MAEVRADLPSHVHLGTSSFWGRVVDAFSKLASSLSRGFPVKLLVRRLARAIDREFVDHVSDVLDKPAHNGVRTGHLGL